MPNSIKLKRSSTVSAVPGSLAEGEIAANTNTGSPRIYLGLSGGTIATITPVSGVPIDMADNLLTRPLVKDYGMELYAHGSRNAATTIDLTNGNVQTATVTGAFTFTFSNPTASGDACSFLLELTNGGAYTVTWPTSVDWSGGNAPVLTAAGVDLLVFYTRDGGTTWHGVVSSLDSK
jgi:hypothetical protein